MAIYSSICRMDDHSQDELLIILHDDHLHLYEWAFKTFAVLCDSPW
jgi:hypothetical protein